MKNSKNKINEDFDTDFFDPLIKVGEDGRSIYNIEGFLRYTKIYGVFFDKIGDISYPLDFNTIYKWPNLNQTNYQINLKPVSIKVLGDAVGQYKFQSDKAIQFKNIKIQFKHKIIPLTSYIDDKKLILDMFVAFREIKGGNQVSSIEYSSLGLKRLNRLLSVGSTWNEWGDVSKGNQNIFESNELLDQMVIATLIQFAKQGHLVSHDILLAILADKIKWFTRKIVEPIHHIESREFEDEALSLISQIILNQHKRFVFTPTNSQSLQHWLIGTGLPVEKKGSKKWIPKLQEYFKDKLQKYYLETKHRFTPQEIEKKEISLEEIKDKESEYKLQKIAEIVILKEKINQLPSRVRDILLMWYEGFPLEVIGKKFGIKKARVSQIINKRIKELKKELSGD